MLHLLDFFVFGYCLVMDSRKKRLKVWIAPFADDFIRIACMFNSQNYKWSNSKYLPRHFDNLQLVFKSCFLCGFCFCCFFFFFFAFSFQNKVSGIYVYMYIYIHTHLYVCVCVCMVWCGSLPGRVEGDGCWWTRKHVLI